MRNGSTSRRQFLGTLAATTAAPLAFSGSATANVQLDETYSFEVTRTDTEWRAMLSEHEFRILREFRTEPHFSSPLWNEERPGRYACRGCDLDLYGSEWKTNLTIGWVFFHHSRANATMTAIDVIGEGDDGTPETMMETHCRRCGSHLGHIVSVEGEVLHCINGTSLVFTATA
jgi:peptide-methionine (R)-S-oxide reductase